MLGSTEHIENHELHSAKATKERSPSPRRCVGARIKAPRQAPAFEVERQQEIEKEKN